MPGRQSVEHKLQCDFISRRITVIPVRISIGSF